MRGKSKHRRICKYGDEVLTFAKGNHRIYPTEAEHFHLYWGDDRAALLVEVVNWPTYYPSGWSYNRP